jgi:cytoskeletal protein RodZ
MKTAGQIIRTERIKKNLSLDQLSQLTKIDVKYLTAIEDDNYSQLPSETFIKGFIRNISLRLEKDPQELVAIFRRDFRVPERKITSQSRHPKISFSSTTLFQYAPYFFGILAFLVYLGFQFRVILTPPKLIVASPEVNSVLVSPVTIEGDTGPDSLIFIGEDSQIRPDENGHFATKINLPLGETELIIKSTNRFGRSSTHKLPLTIISK